MMKKTPVVHSSASVFSTEGVLTGHGPSSMVSTTSFSRRKSSCLKCSKPNPGPPVVSISTTRLIPSASGLLQGGLAGAGVAARAGAAAGLAGGVCDHAAPLAQSEIAPAKINPAAIRMLGFPCVLAAPGRGRPDGQRRDFPASAHHSRVAALRYIGFSRIRGPAVRFLGIGQTIRSAKPDTRVAASEAGSTDYIR